MKDFASDSDFVKGEILQFVRCQGYLRYDEEFVYEFRGSSGEVKLWSAPSDMTEEQMYDFMVLA